MKNKLTIFKRPPQVDMQERIRPAEVALHERKNEFDLNHGGTPEESKAIEDALNGLNVLRKEVAGWQRSKRAG
jgi:hypothetical protein